MSLIELWHAYHLKLYGLARELDGVFILDADLAQEQSGKALVVDPAQSNGIFDHPTRAGAQVLGDHFLRSLQILEGNRPQVKCAVLDLDNTLWSGVLREDGPGGVSVNEYYLNVLEKMAARGILLAISSKNDAAERQHLPALLGTELHSKIVSCQLHWRPKSEALQEIAAQLNIGLDSLAFFDDSPFERAEVRAHAPQVLVYEPEDLFACLNRPEFHPRGAITEEANSRTTKYQQQALRQQAERSSGGNLGEFLASCDFQLELRAPEHGEISRVHELLQRTNQLHATLTRPSLGELNARFQDSSNSLMRIAMLKDRFGDYGLIGFAAVDIRDATWEIVDLAFSCRAMGRGVELAMLHHLYETALAEGIREIAIQFRSGPKNQQMLEILLSSGLTPEGEVDPPEGSSQRLSQQLNSGRLYPVPPWLKLVSPTETLSPQLS
jgi:FkbH-like protein